MDLGLKHIYFLALSSQGPGNGDSPTAVGSLR